jgi:hypothetical protein
VHRSIVYPCSCLHDAPAASSTTYGYNFRDLLTSATDGPRSSTTASNTTTQYLIDGLNPTGYPQVIKELVGDAVQRTYTYGHDLSNQNRLLAATWTPRFYGYDGPGQRALRNRCADFTFTANGSILSITGEPAHAEQYRRAGASHSGTLAGVRCWVAE